MKNLLVLPFLLLCSLVFAQFPTVKWEYPIGAPAFGSAASADLDEDGFYEIVFTTYTNDGRAHCLNAEDGSVKWIYDIGGCGDVAPIIYDVNLDGVLDVVINGSCNPTIFCINGATGELIWSKASGGGDSPPTIADIDMDGKPEVLFGNFNGEVRVLNGEDGTTAKIIQAEPNFRALQTEPTLVDVNEDGQLDILAANFFNDEGLFVWAYNYSDGALIWENIQINEDADFHAYHSGALADIDNDEKLEYVIGSGGGYIHAINVEDGSNLWKKEFAGSNMSAVSIADLDEDGVLEVVFNNNDNITFDSRIWVLSGLDGSLEWSYPITFTAFRGFSISDINGNGQLDLISGHFMGAVRVVEPYQGLIWEEQLRDYFQPGLPWFEADHQPLVADFDQNGTADIFVVGGYGTYVPDSLNTGSAFLIEAGEGGCPEWLMFRHDVNRTGYLSPEQVAADCISTEVSNEITDLLSFQISPNPAREKITIEIDLLRTGYLEVLLYDPLGRQTEILVEEFHQGGEYQHTFSRQNKPTGIYFCQVRLDGHILGQEKFIFD